MKSILAGILFATAIRGADVKLSMTGLEVVPGPVRFAAAEQAARMFAVIGVRLQWTKHRPMNPDRDLPIQVRLIRDMAGHPGALAYANPFDPAPVITVLYDRIVFATERAPEVRGAVLAHVLAHEIGHVLMKNDAHSPEGIMKAHWSGLDWPQITYGQLTFLPADADMIRRGAIARADAIEREEGVVADQAAARSRELNTTEPKFQIQIFDYAGIAPKPLGLFVSELESIFSRRGIDVHVSVCRGSIESACDRPTPLIIRILPGEAKVMHSVRRPPLGQIAAQEACGGYADLFLSPVYDNAAVANVPSPAVLAHAAAHEIGHLVLGSNEHVSPWIDANDLGPS